MRPAIKLSARAICIGIGFAIASLAAADDRDLHLDARPVFDGMWTSNRCLPFVVTVENVGKSASGELKVETDSYAMTFPLDLPYGSKKQFVAYPIRVEAWGNTSFTLETDKGSTSVKYEPKDGAYGARYVGMITDHPGQLGFLQPKSTDSMDRMNRITACYTAAELAPDRTTGYSSINVLFLSSGSERLSGPQVKAIQDWVMTGGTIVILGGASSPLLADKRWSRLVPIRAPITKNLARSTFLNSYAKFTGNFAITTGSLIPGAAARMDAGSVIAASREYGFGLVQYWAFNPFDRPLVQWEGRAKLVEEIAERASTEDSLAWLGQELNSESGLVPQSETARASSSPPPPVSAVTVTKEDPFSISLPGPERIFTLLLLFFVVVVPVNFLLLRKLGKSEWAWVSSPIISLAFAGAFFVSARELYRAGLSRAVNSVIITREGADHSYVVGRAQLFFPQGGQYDLKLGNIDQIAAKDPNADYYGYRPNRIGEDPKQIGAYDVGHIEVPRFTVSNLSFRELYFNQDLPISGLIRSSVRTHVTGQGNLRISGSITNSSPFVMQNARFDFGQQSMELGLLSPGQTVTLDGKPVSSRNRSNDGISDDQFAFYARTVADQIGPQIGQLVGQRSSTVILVFIEPKRGTER